MDDKSKMYSLTIEDTEIFIRYPRGYNPYANLAIPRISEKKMLAGTNYQDSGLYHSDGRFIISGDWLDPDAQEALLNEYYGQRRPMLYKSYLSDPPEEWLVIFGSFVPYPQNVQYENQQSWTLELFILGKYINGELVR
mgnify:FL=1